MLSGVGKGVSSASIGAILKSKGFKVTAIKIDPYVNVDAGTMNPTEHGEVFVTNDGDETDQDMGNYERFLDTEITSANYMTTGRVYLSVIEKERNLEYKGKCVEVVPHIPEEVIRRIKNASEMNDADFTIIEVGGTVGEYQNILFLEAAREMKMANPEDVCFILVSYLPVPSHLGEMKTKPTQTASRQLNSAGILADFIIARGQYELDEPRKAKLSILCGVRPENCISAPDTESIYDVPLNFERQDLGNKILKRLLVEPKESNLSTWTDIVNKIKSSTKKLKIAVVGKYFGTGNFVLADSYISVIESIKHAAFNNDVRVKMYWIDSEEFEKDPSKLKELEEYHGVIVPGGFGTRGIEGIIMAIKYARENKIPYLGLCYGMQLACIEFVRNVLGKEDAHTLEVNPNTKNPVIHINERQASNVENKKYGGTMRLGAYDCRLIKGTKTFEAYGNEVISERHRHRYEFNNDYRNDIESNGLMISGVNDQENLVEIVELKDHPWFVGCQFHPEFKSRPMRPHPLFDGFIKASKTIIRDGVDV